MIYRKTCIIDKLFVNDLQVFCKESMNYIAKNWYLAIHKGFAK